MTTSPKAGRAEPGKKAQMVETVTVKQQTVNIPVSGLGTVIPSQRVTLYPEVSGRVDSILDGLVPGSRVRKGELLVALDQDEYQILVREQEAVVAQAWSELKLEQGQQNIARQEYELTGNKLSPEEEALVLRQPQLEAVKAALSQAQANLDQAKLNLERTHITAPFDSQIINNTIYPGSQVSNSTALMALISTDRFWIEMEVPAEQLKWLNFANESPAGSAVKITSPEWGSESRQGTLISVSPELNDGSLMAKVIIEIEDPLAQREENNGEPPVMINDLLRAEILGKKVDNAFVVPEALIRNSHQVWLLTRDNSLEIRNLSPVYRDSEKAILLSGLEDGDQLVSSSLITPVDGLPLRTPEKPFVAGKQP
ncbi:efflux RND transporter periplasmic adaptor subunit [Endozoicomonas sp. 8E]|uniref:efflux RND transporter periplasmic adaptor subunit n=1 Tax=Endozoicomonas sp. 8E TaxID=3035692 RepID=UPI0029392A95|nr:efflux RND transporter periplasmic adaptor subunit [Endozoicomonas sp. 8E]WOG26838.1 efflux RND transporter periplasmic adaptor subunit [Endozoicomonas sp. 8E]